MTTLEVPKQTSESQSVPVLAALWQSRMETLFGVKKPLMPKEFGQLKLLGKRLGDVTSKVIDLALSNWGSFATKAAAETGTGVWPVHPHIGFLLTHHAVALELHTIATAPAILPDSTPINAANLEVNFGTEQKKEKEEVFKLTSAQVAKMMAAMEPDGDLDKFWAEIELENKNNAAMSEEMYGLTGYVDTGIGFGN